MRSLVETNPTKEVTDYIRERLEKLDADFEMGYFFSEDIANAKNLEHVDAAMLSEAVRGMNTSFYLVVRSRDEFSPAPYIWVSARPYKWAKETPPERCWVIRNPDGKQSLRVNEGLLVFSRMGYANGHVTSLGIGDFNLESFSWSELAKAVGDHHGFAVIDCVEGEEMVIMPFK